MKSMDTNNLLLENLSSLLTRFQGMKDELYLQYQHLVDRILCDEPMKETDIERIMDSLVDLCHEERFIELYRKLCRHIYYHYPQLVGEHVAMFRMQFEENSADKDEK